MNHFDIESKKISEKYFKYVRNYIHKCNNLSIPIYESSQASIEPDEIDPELFKIVDLKLSKGRFWIQKNVPFYWRVLRRLKTVLTYSVPTMAVDDLGNIYMNPDFTANTLDQDGVTAVLAHECGHIMGLSFFRKKYRDHQLWNVATDYVINRGLLSDGFKLPDDDKFRALLPIMRNGRWIIPQYDDVDITDFTAEKMYHTKYFEPILLEEYLAR